MLRAYLLQLAFVHCAAARHLVAGPIFLARVILAVIEGDDPWHGPNLAPLVALIGITCLLACILRRDRIAHFARRAVARCCGQPGSGRPAARNGEPGIADRFTEMARDVLTEPFEGV
jgi:hypothetical protein